MRIDRKPLQAEIIARIRGYIEQRGLQEGDALPSQMEMVDLFGVSRSSIREALKTLEALDVVRVINGRGVFVRHVDTRMILARAFDIRKKEHFLEILGVRKLLEDEIIRQAVKRATEEDQQRIDDRLQRMLERVKELKDSGGSFYELESLSETEDVDFHKALHRACHNPTLIQMIEILTGAFRKEWRELLQLGGTHAELVQYHVDLARHLRARDAEKAIQANDRIVHCVAQMADTAVARGRLWDSPQAAER
ncbi:MAG: FadR family transcriptional regulator [Spirochaetaceae bacterium]|nr:MAG: FadR family transcriptional regulator [Spirochaetaceae bacterium]